MRLSHLQKFILRKCLAGGRGKTNRKVFLEFYKNQKVVPSQDKQVKIITQSMERLIDKGLLVGFGRKTQEKMFIESIQLTAKGRTTAKGLLGKQISLPFPKRKRVKH